MSFNFDRRTFLKGAGAVGAASLLAACGEKSNNTGNGAAASGAAAPNSTGAEPEERTYCSLLSNLVLGLPLVAAALIASVL